MEELLAYGPVYHLAGPFVQRVLHAFCLYVYTPLQVFLPGHPVEFKSSFHVRQHNSYHLNALCNIIGVIYISGLCT